MNKRVIAFVLILMLVFPCSIYGATDGGTTSNKDSISNNSVYTEGESTQEDFSEQLGSEGGIEIYGKNNLSFDVPVDGQMEIIVLVKNTNDYAVEMAHGSAYDIDSRNFSGSITNYCSDWTAIMHPNGSDYIIEANSEITCIFDLSLPNFNNQDASIDGDLNFKYNYKFTYESEGRLEEVADMDLTINSTIHYYGRTARSKSSRRTATIKGVVVDSKGNPVKGAEIETFNTFDENIDPVMTDSKGKFEIKVTPHKSNNTKTWHECLLRFRHDSFDEKTVCVYPKTNQTNELKIVLQEPSKKLNYTNTKVVDLGIQAYSYDTDANKSVIAFTPFHSGWKYDNIKDILKLSFTDFDGNTKFTYSLNAETPWVCVSDDGEYVVTIQAINGGNEESTNIVVLDKNGNTKYTASVEKDIDTPQGIEKQIIHSRCAQLSHDNKYLVIGSDDGDFWVYDWQSNKEDKLLWSGETHGQVRNIAFNDANNKLYVSSGDGYMYGFDIEGNQLFKTYVGSWATDMKLVDNKLIYTIKSSWNSVACIDVSNGNVKWIYQGLARGSGLAVSKDNKYVWWGNDVCSSYSYAGNIILDIETGEIAYTLCPGSAQQAMFSDNGKYLVVKTSTELQLYETENYSCVWRKTVIEGDGENTASINQTVAINADGSKIVAAFNNDSSGRCYGQAYYYSLDVNKEQISENMVSDIPDQTYTGEEIKPDVTVKGLTEGTDYTVTYTDNVNAGTAKATITGIGKLYSGTVEKTFTIKKAVISTEGLSLQTDSFTYNGRGKRVALTSKPESVTVTSSGTSGTKVGTYTATFELTPTDSANTQVDKSTYIFDWKITPARACIKSMPFGARKLKVKLTTKPSSKGGGYYQIAYKQQGSSEWKYRYSLSDNKTINNLKKGKQYYVRVRACKLVKGKIYFGAWSSVKVSNKIK